nr:retrovirus-related Pol polyprotein from transposon TNT 1-94 [Tanacetum cinerariifolium]
MEKQYRFLDAWVVLLDYILHHINHQHKDHYCNLPFHDLKNCDLLLGPAPSEFTRDVTFHEDLPYFPVTTYRHQKENDDLLVYVSPNPIETIKQSAKLDAPPLKVYARRPRITSDLVREQSSQLKDAPIDAPNDAPNDVSNDVPISAPNEAYGESDAPSDAPNGSYLPPPSSAPELDLPIALRKGKRTCRYPVFAFVSYDGLSTFSRAFVANLDLILVPKTVGEALAHSGWRAAMIEEMDALDHNDVKKAFLHGDLEEEVYIEQPSVFVAQGEYGRVCKLMKALYGLKQSPHTWFGKFSNAVILFGLRRSVYDHFVFYSSSDASCILLVVYVNDIVITSSDKAGIKKLKSFIGTCFQTKDLELLKYFLGVEVSRSSKGICLSQRKYCLDLLDDSGQIKAKPCDEPMIPKLKLKSEDGRLLHNPEKYRRVVGKLNYLTITRLDIAFPVSVVRLGILYANHGHPIAEGFSDADYAGCPNTSRSTIGYCVFVGGNLVYWKIKKQNVVSRPSSGAEYRAMAQTTCELAAIYIATNLVFHERTKHIENDCHFTREKLEDGTIATPHIILLNNIYALIPMK